MSAPKAEKLPFSDPQGEANYHAARRADRAQILTWVNKPLCAPDGELIANSIDLSVATLTAVERIADAARATGLTARVHVKVDTGFGRNGLHGSTIRCACRTVS